MEGGQRQWSVTDSGGSGVQRFAAGVQGQTPNPLTRRHNGAGGRLALPVPCCGLQCSCNAALLGIGDILRHRTTAVAGVLSSNTSDLF